MGENEQGGMLRTVVVVGLVALIAAVIIGGVVVSKANMNKHIDNTTSLVEKQANAVTSRNLILNSSGIKASATNRPAMQANGLGSGVAYDATIAYNPDSITITYTGNGKQEWYYALAESYQSYASGNLDKTKQYTISVDVKGTAPSAGFRVNNAYSPSVSINNKTWTRLTYTFTFPALTGDYADKYYIRLNAMNGNINGNFVPGQILSFRNFKLETGNTATDWTSAPKD